MREEDLCLIPDDIDDATAGGVPVAYLTAQITLTQAGFQPGKTVLAPAIGGAVGNAVIQLARAQGAGRTTSTTTNPAKAEQARALGFHNVIDFSAEGLADGVARITGSRGVDVVIDSVGGALTGQALATLAPAGVLTSLGYSAGRKTTIDVIEDVTEIRHRIERGGGVRGRRRVGGAAGDVRPGGLRAAAKRSRSIQRMRTEVSLAGPTPTAL